MQGGRAQLLTAHLADQPAWSPDGRLIAITLNNNGLDGNWEIYTMDAVGNNLSQLTRNDANDLYPAWSPDGRQIAFISYRDGRAELYLMEADGSHVRRLTNNRVEEASPAWSPDGTQIAFESHWEILVIEISTGIVQQLTDNDSADREPVWSPDGRSIAFISGRDSGNAQLYIMNADGSNQRRLTQTTRGASSPDWQP
jgi:TolB protein